MRIHLLWIAAGAGLLLTRLVLGAPAGSTIRFSSTAYFAAESDSSAFVTVARQGALDSSVTVKFSTSDESAKAGQDYVSSSGTLTFAPGETNKTLQVKLIDDGTVEGEETLALFLSNPSGLTVLGNPSQATLSIRDNESPSFIDTSFKRDFAPYGIETMCLQPDGKLLLVAGLGPGTNGLIRVNTDGTRDDTFKAPTAMLTINDLALDVDGNVLAGGYGVSNSVPYETLARFNPDGSLDTTFRVEVATTNNYTASVSRVVPLLDRRIFIRGNFSSVNGIREDYQALLRADGTVDTGFDRALFRSPAGPGWIAALLSTPDGKLLVGGSFTSAAGVPRTNIARLNADNSVDLAFVSRLHEVVPSVLTVGSLALQSDGKIVVAGLVANADSTNEFDSVLPYIARLTAAGEVDSTFVMDREVATQLSQIEFLRVAPDDKIDVGGAETQTVPNESQSYKLLRLNSDGSMERKLTAAVELAGGILFENPRPAVLPDGRVIGNVFFPSPRRTLAGRFLSDFTSAGVSFARALFDTGEDRGIAIITLNRTGDTTKPMPIQFRTEDGTAKAGTDYDAQQATVTFAPLESTKFLTIPLHDDGLVNGNRTVLLKLSDPGNNAVAGEFTQATLRIRDNEAPTLVDPTFHADLGPLDPCAILPQADGGVVVKCRRPEGGFVILRLNRDGTRDGLFDPAVSSPNDIPCETAPRTVQLPDGSTLVSNDDHCLQRIRPNHSEDPSFQFCLSSLGELAAGAFIGYFIPRPDGRIVLTFYSLRDYESSIVLLEVDGTPMGPPLALQSNLRSVVAAPDGTLLVAITDVGRLQNEILRLLPAGSEAADIQVDAPVLQVGEGQSIATLTVQRTGPSTRAVDVHYTTSDGSAHAGAEYDPLNGTLHFAPLETLKTIAIPVRDNWLPNSDRSFKIVLGNSTDNGVLDAGRASIITIHDDDRPGSVDLTFRPPSVSPVAATGAFSFPASALAVQSDGKILAAGLFTLTNPITGTTTSALRMNPDGSLDTSFELVVPISYGVLGGIWPSIAVFAPSPDGTILIGGNAVDEHLTVNGESRRGIARLHGNGALDRSFNASVDGSVQAGVIQEDGTIIIGGNFPAGIRRLSANGETDSGFNAGAGVGGQQLPCTVHAVLIQPDHKIIIGGNFSSYNGTQRQGIARLHADGSLDETFDPQIGLASAGHPGGWDSSILSMALQLDGKILIAGRFDRFNGVLRGGVARLNADGSVDTNFAEGLQSGEYYRPPSIALQWDKILVAGMDLSVGNDGRSGVLRLDASGALDPTFDPGISIYDPSGSDPWVSAILPMADGGVLLGGSFSTFDGVPREGFVRLHGDPQLRFATIQTDDRTRSELNLVTVPGQTYLVEGSSDLRQWAPIRTNVAASFLLTVQDSEVKAAAQRFFRARLLNP